MFFYIPTAEVSINRSNGDLHLFSSEDLLFLIYEGCGRAARGGADAK